MIETELERGAGAARFLMGVVLGPWGGSAACIDAYEQSVRTATELQLTIARTIDLEPARSFATSYADLTRDLVAQQVSSARWLLEE